MRLSEDEWVLAESIAEMYGVRGAGAGLRRALDMARLMIAQEGVAKSRFEAECPRGGHAFTWDQPSKTLEPKVGELVICNGPEEFFCGYQFVWRGGEKITEISRRIRTERAAGDR